MNWKNELTDAITQAIKSENITEKQINFYNKNFKLKLFILVDIPALIIILVLIGLGIKNYIKWSINDDLKFYFMNFILPIIIIATATLIITAVIFFRKGSIISKIQKNVISQINLKTYYEKAINQELNNNIVINNFSTYFDNWTSFMKNIPDHNMLVENVLNMSVSNCNFSMGTRTERREIREIDHYGQEIIKYLYYRTIIFTGQLKENLDFAAHIHPAMWINKFFKNSQIVHLESPEFNKLFNITANDQIKIRKIITPKAMVDLMDLIKSENKAFVPSIIIEGNEISLLLPEFRVNSFNDPHGVLGKVDLRFKIDEIKTKYLDKVQLDINLLKNFLTWLATINIVLN